VFASAALLGLGGWLVVQQSLTLGQLVAAELIVAAVASSIAKVGKLLDSTYDLLTGVDKLGHLVDLPLEAAAPGEAVPGQGPVRVVAHGASDGEAAPLDLEVTAGERVAIVGAEGHALASWLAAARVPQRGAVAHNTVETSRERWPSVRDAVAFIQHGDFFQGTLLENLTLGRVGVTASDVRAALERVGLLDELRALPEGLETELGPNGAPLTACQLTRLLVARALAGSPRLIVVEASLDGLAPDLRARSVAALTRASAPWTLVAFVEDTDAELARACSRKVALAELTGEGLAS
jgi:putative ABC transport system ATP-binding protein